MESEMLHGYPRSKAGPTGWVTIATILPWLLCLLGLVLMAIYCVTLHEKQEGRISAQDDHIRALHDRISALEKLFLDQPRADDVVSTRGSAHVQPPHGSPKQVQVRNVDKMDVNRLDRHRRSKERNRKTRHNRRKRCTPCSEPTHHPSQHLVPVAPTEDSHLFLWSGSGYPARDDIGTFSGGYEISISQSGTYWVYGQVTFRGRTSNGTTYNPCTIDIICKRRSGSSSTILSAHTKQMDNGQSIPDSEGNPIYPVDSVYTAGAFRFANDDRLWMELSPLSHGCMTYSQGHHEKTFFGNIYLGP